MGQIWPLAFNNKGLLEHSHTHLFRYYLWLFCATEAKLIDNVTETVCLTKPKVFTICPFTDRVCQLLV